MCIKKRKAIEGWIRTLTQRIKTANLFIYIKHTNRMLTLCLNCRLERETETGFLSFFSFFFYKPMKPDYRE